MTNRKRTGPGPTPQIIGDFAVFKSTGIWVVRHMHTGREWAHENSQRDAFTVARRFMNEKEA